MGLFRMGRRMHLGIPALLDFFRAHRQDEALVLATIVATSGSTYRKPGAMMLIARDGSYEGLISGGCLEGDLLHHAAAVFESGRPSSVTYDMHADEELVWNLGLGCDGVIHLLLQRLDREFEFGFLERLEGAQALRQASLLGLVTQGSLRLPTGTFGWVSRDISIGEQGLVSELEKLDATAPDWRWQPLRPSAEGEVDAIAVRLPPPTRVLICGAGPDALPMARAFAGLDWEVVVVDHRPAFARADRFPARCQVIATRPGSLSEHLDLTGLDAAVIMSHHLENDSGYLAQLAPLGLAYVGVLGPRSRRDRLLEMTRCPEVELFGPVGLDIGAELPASIALSVAAEVHAALNRRDGRSLTRRADHER
jgi:xanthine dehydrogenase accessory factor